MHKEIAQWLYDKIMAEGNVYQSEAVDEITHRFGAEYIYTNDLGNPAIDRKVLSEFRKLKGDDIVWDRSDLFWYKESEISKEFKSSMPDFPKIKFPKVKIDPIKFDDNINLE